MAAENNESLESNFSIGENVTKENIKSFLAQGFTISRGVVPAQRIWTIWTELHNSNFSDYIEQAEKYEINYSFPDSEFSVPILSILTNAEAEFLLAQGLMSTGAHEPAELDGTPESVPNPRTGSKKAPLNTMIIHFEVSTFVSYFVKDIDPLTLMLKKSEILYFLDFAGQIPNGASENNPFFNSITLEDSIQIIKNMDDFLPQLKNYVSQARNRNLK